MPPVVRTRARDRRDAGNDGAAGRPAPERGESDVSSSSSLRFFASDEAAAAGDQPGGKQLHNLRRQRARSKRYVESSVATVDTSDEEWSPGGGGKKKQQRKKWGGGAKRGGEGRKKKVRRHSVETVASDGRLVISKPHAHDVLSGRGGGKQRKYRRSLYLVARYGLHAIPFVVNSFVLTLTLYPPSLSISTISKHRYQRPPGKSKVQRLGLGAEGILHAGQGQGRQGPDLPRGTRPYRFAGPTGPLPDARRRG